MSVLALASPVLAVEWEDNFDSYALGTKMDDVGGWFGWDDNPDAAGTIVDAQSLSSPHAMGVSTPLGEDAVHPFTPYSSGAWTFTGYQYIPSNLDDLTYFILNSVYEHGGNHEWAIEMHMDPATGLVTEEIHGGNSTSIIYDAWVKVHVNFDLDADTCEAYYNDTLLYSGQWTSSSYPTLAFANVDLYAPHTVDVYWDNLSLTPEPASLILLAVGALALRRR
jgi:hypothetical protein